MLCSLLRLSCNKMCYEAFQILQHKIRPCKTRVLKYINERPRQGHNCKTPTIHRGWSGGAMVLGKLPVPGRPTAWILEGQGPIALAVGAGGRCLDIFTLLYLFSPLSPTLWETARYRLKYCLKGPFNPKQPTNQPTIHNPKEEDRNVNDRTKLRNGSNRHTSPNKGAVHKEISNTFVCTRR